MSRPTALSQVSTAALQAEIERRVSKLADLLILRDDMDRQIAELNVLAGQFGQAVPAPTPVAKGPRPVVKRRRRRKAGIAKVVAKSVAKTAERGQAGQPTSEFILGLFSGGKTLTSADLAQAWAASGRNGKIDTPLSRLVNAKRLKRRRLRGQRGSNYKVAAGPAELPSKAEAVKPVAKPVAKKPSQYPQTADQFILGLLQGETLTTRQLGEAWKTAGRGGTVAKRLSLLAKMGKINRKPLGGKLGSNYSLP